MVFKVRVNMVRAKLYLVMAILGLLAVPIVACSSAPTHTSDPSTIVETEEPMLSTTLKRNCPPTVRGNFDSVGLAIGEMAVNFTLKDIHGNEFVLSRLLAEKPVVMVFGSFTCPPFRRLCAANDTLSDKYGDQVHFIIIHVRESHAVDTGRPSLYTYDEEGNPIYESQTYDERLEVARKTVAAEGITVPVLVDEMDNPLWCTYGPAPNIAYLIATDGTIVEKQGWYQPQEMEVAIIEYLARDDN